MKKVFIIILVLTTCSSFHAQTWNRDYGVFITGWADISDDIEVVNDSIYLVYSDQNPIGGRQLNVSNLNLENGNVVWTKTYTANYESRNGGGFNSMNGPNENGHFVLAEKFETWEEGGEPGDEITLAELVKFDESFDTLYTSIIGNPDHSFYGFRQARFTSDGGSIAIGNTRETSDVPGWNTLLTKFDANGDEEWSAIHSIFSNYWNDNYSIVQLQNGNYVTGGLIRENLSDAQFQTLTLFDENGNYLDHRLFGGDDWYAPGWANVNPLSNGNILMSATVEDNAGDSYYYLSEIDQNLNSVWEKYVYSESSVASIRQVKENVDGTLIAVGTWANPDTSYEFGFIMNLTGEGDLIWNRKYQHIDFGFAQINRLWDVAEIPNQQGYVACGERNGIDTGQNVWVIKVDSFGCLIPGCNTDISINEINSLHDTKVLIGPNPTSEYLNVYIPQIPSHVFGSGLTLTLRNIEGKKLKSTVIENSDMTYILNVNQYERGTYFLSVSKENHVFINQKLILN